MFAQEVAKGLVGELLNALHRLACQQVERLPSLLVEFDELAPALGWLAGRVHREPQDLQDNGHRGELFT